MLIVLNDLRGLAPRFQKLSENFTLFTLLNKSRGNAVQRAVEHIFERKSVVNGHEIIAEELNRSPGFINLYAMRRYMTSAY